MPVAEPERLVVVHSTNRLRGVTRGNLSYPDLLLGAGLMIKSLLRLSSVDPGFETEGRLVAGLDLLAHVDEPIEQRLVRMNGFFEAARTLPGVEAVGVNTMMPLQGRGSRSSLLLEGQAEGDERDNPMPVLAWVNRDYFDAMGIPEVGIRMALGALPGQVIGLVLREGLALILVGLVLGLPLALGLARVLASTLYGVEGFEPRLLLLMVLVLGLVGTAAALLPARRAVSVDPAKTLYAE